MTDDTDIDDLREQHRKGSRITAAAEQTDRADRQEVLVEEYRAVLDGDASRTLSFRDEFVAGLIHAAERDDDLREALAEGLQAELEGRDEAATDRSELLRQAVRVGLREAAADVVEDARDAYGRASTEDVL